MCAYLQSIMGKHACSLKATFLKLDSRAAENGNGETNGNEASEHICYTQVPSGVYSLLCACYIYKV